jgi:hypothetical protein
MSALGQKHTPFKFQLTNLSVRRFNVATRTRRCGIRHTAHRQLHSEWMPGVAPALRFKLQLRTCWRVEPHGLGERKVFSRPKSATELPLEHSIRSGPIPARVASGPSTRAFMSKRTKPALAFVDHQGAPWSFTDVPEMSP